MLPAALPTPLSPMSKASDMMIATWLLPHSHVAVVTLEALSAGDKGGELGTAVGSIVFEFVEDSTANVLKALCKEEKELID